MKLNEIRGGTYLPDWRRIDQRRLHREAKFSLKNVTRNSQFSNSILVKFDCVFGNHWLLTYSSLKLSIWFLGPWTWSFPSFHLATFFHPPSLIFLSLLLTFSSFQGSLCAIFLSHLPSFLWAENSLINIHDLNLHMTVPWNLYFWQTWLMNTSHTFIHF